MSEDKNTTAPGAENVSMETPDFAGELNKDTAETVAKITDEAAAKMAAEPDEDNKEKIKAEAEAKKKEVVQKKTTGTASKIKAAEPADEAAKVPGLKITVSGVIARDGKSVSYEYDDIILPACVNVMQYLKQAVFLRFKQDGQPIAIEDIITYYLDDESEVEMAATFLDKDILKMSEEEVLAAKIYYKLKAVVIDQGVRQARVSLYKACCRVMGRAVPDDTDTQIAKWPKFKLSK